MYIQMLKNQHVTFVYTVEEAERFSPFSMKWNAFSSCYVVYKDFHNVVAAGLSREEAEACVIFKANEYILWNMA